MKKIFLTFAVLFVLGGQSLYSQSTQLWWDYMGYPLNSSDWDYEINPGFNHLLGEDGWFDFYVNNTVTYQKLQWLLFDGSLELHYTKDEEYYNSIEVRPWVMTSVRWLTEGEHLNLYNPYFAVMFEYRNIFYDNEELNEHKFRMRLRAGGKFTINSKKMAVGTLYIPFRGEYFVDLGSSVTEKFADRHRIMIGLGYIFNSAIRTEVVYYLQGSRNTYEDKFTETDNIFQFLVRHYF